MIISYQLSKEQNKYKEAFEWLCDDRKNRQKGRTYLLAITFLNLALKYPNRSILIFDNVVWERAKTNVIKEIKKLIPEIHLSKFVIKRDSIKYLKK